MKYYAGIGSRETPEYILDHISSIAQVLGNNGWTLRSGGADGADTAFEAGALASATPPHIYLPWRGFNDRSDESCRRHSPEAWTLEIAAKHHPAWPNLSRGGRALHCRNVHQILGSKDEPHSSFVLCWTPEARGGGGTGQAIRIAKSYGIRVFDLADRTVLDHVRERMGLR